MIFCPFSKGDKNLMNFQKGGCTPITSCLPIIKIWTKHDHNNIYKMLQRPGGCWLGHCVTWQKKSYKNVFFCQTS